MSRKSLALKEARLPRNDLRLDGQLLAGESERFLRERLGHARELEHDAPRLHDRDPVLWRALARPHARLGRLLGHRLVRLDRRLRAALAGRRSLVGARTLDVVLAARAIARRGPRSAASASRRAAATAGGATAALAPATALRADRPQIGPIALAIAPALAGRAEPFLCAAAPPPCLVLVTQTNVLVGVEAAVTLPHDPALVDPDLDADPAEGQLRLDEAVIDVGADRMERHATLRVRLRP